MTRFDDHRCPHSLPTNPHQEVITMGALTEQERLSANSSPQEIDDGWDHIDLRPFDVTDALPIPTPDDDPVSYCPCHHTLSGHYISPETWQKMAFWLTRLVGPRPNPPHIDELCQLALRWAAPLAFCDTCTTESLLWIAPLDPTPLPADAAALPLAA